MAASMEPVQGVGTMVSFGQRMTRSARFTALFAEGMDLVEEAAAYLDGSGRDDARALRPSLAGAYSTESMRLTTRLMQIASWLLIRRAIVEGESTSGLEGQSRFKPSPQSGIAPSAIFAQLPAPLQSLATRSVRLQTRILHLDEMVAEERDDSAPRSIPNGPSEQMAMLRTIFGQVG